MNATASNADLAGVGRPPEPRFCPTCHRRGTLTAHDGGRFYACRNCRRLHRVEFAKAPPDTRRAVLLPYAVGAAVIAVQMLIAACAAAWGVL